MANQSRAIPAAPQRPRSFHHRMRQVYVKLGDVVTIYGGAFAGQTGRVIYRSPAGVHVTIPGRQIPVFVALRYLLEPEATEHA
jgi:transcription antitermination factor NusG